MFEVKKIKKQNNIPQKEKQKNSITEHFKMSKKTSKWQNVQKENIFLNQQSQKGIKLSKNEKYRKIILEVETKLEGTQEYRSSVDYSTTMENEESLCQKMFNFDRL